MAVLESIERRRFSVEEVERMLEAGILLEDESVELLEGDLVVMSPQNPQHATGTETIARLLEEVYGATVHARRHSPIFAANDSLPEPDVAIYRGQPRDYRDRHPTGKEALLIVEISSSSRRIDRHKATIYAKAGVPTYWLLDLVAVRLEVRSGPQADGLYELTRVLGRNDEVEVPGTEAKLSVASLLP